MAIDKIRVMISSRSNTTVFNPPVSLKRLRRFLKDFIVQKLKISEEPLFEVWICEDDTGEGIDSWWETSKEEVRKADLVLVLYTGEAGSRVQDIGLGICHAELFEAANYSREKILTILTLGDATAPSRPEDRSFQNYVQEFERWPNFAGNEEELLMLCSKIIRKKLVTLTRKAVRRRLGASYDMGNALDWSKLDFESRKQKIEEVLFHFLLSLGGKNVAGKWESGSRAAVVAIDKTPVLWCVHAIPAATSIAAARELVGQPFVRDHLAVPLLIKSRSAGPVHLIGCHKSITESQALKIRGIADCTIVKTDFGIYLADGIQKIQILFLADCRDLTATQSAITEMFQWFEQSEEKEDIVKRARSRKNILKAIAKEMQNA
ncbi:MAG: hypothetical protein JSW39_21095 [Desulfobacterales bacterium]|nr:MAG: hypothetical protein JSW39_21095 [Desulfobacterales bacterium]